jgi:hypothetical protein
MTLLCSREPRAYKLVSTVSARFASASPICLRTALGTIVGVLSIMTAGYWGQISDAFGRKIALSAIIFGMTFQYVSLLTYTMHNLNFDPSDVIYIMVSVPDSIFHEHAWGFLVLGPVVEGLLGGLTTIHAAQNA